MPRHDQDSRSEAVVHHERNSRVSATFKDLEDAAVVVLSISTFKSPVQSLQNQIDYSRRQ